MSKQIERKINPKPEIMGKEKAGTHTGFRTISSDQGPWSSFMALWYDSAMPAVLSSQASSSDFPEYENRPPKVANTFAASS
jgi:hypothetical protein